MFKLLNLDRVNYLGRRLDKKMFYDNGDFNKEDRKIFADYIDRIEMSYLINSTNLNIQPFINDEYYYKAIAYLKITLKQDGKLDKISKIINNTIPNPIVIIYELENKYKISTAIKRLSKSEKDKTVIEESRSTPWLDINNLKDNEKIFIESISLNKLPYTNLFDFYKVMNDKIYIFEKSLEFGEYKDINNKEELRLNKEISEKIEKLEADLKKTIIKLKRENQFAKKMELNVKATELQKEIDELKNSL